MLQKNDNINIRCNSILKDKFIVAIWFNDISAVFTDFMQKTVREYEKNIAKIPVRTDKAWLYDLITKVYWIKINERTFYEILNFYPKTKKNIWIYGDIK